MEYGVLGLTAGVLIKMHFYDKIRPSWITTVLVLVLGIIVAYLLRYQPTGVAQEFIVESRAYLPPELEQASRPIYDFTRKWMHRTYGGHRSSTVNPPPTSFPSSPTKGPTTKRHVSESLKKKVAADQGWVCGHCGVMLPPSYEVDHRLRLEFGGSNGAENLVALCRNCHGQKTLEENIRRRG